MLSNVGLLYFKDIQESPVDLFPILGCQIDEVEPAQVGGATTVFRLQYASKRVTFKCFSLTEFDVWIKSIRKLQEETEAKRDKMKARELERISQLSKVSGLHGSKWMSLKV